MTSASSPTVTFAPVAQQVRRRVWLRRWLGWLEKTVWPSAGVLGTLILTLVLVGNTAAVTWGTVAFIVWLLAAAALATWKMPNTYSALAFWDTQTGRREAFASAWWFEQQPERSTAEESHILQQHALLPEAQKKLAQDVPIPLFKRWIEVPCLLLIALHLITVAQRDETALSLDPAMAALAKSESDKLAKTDWEKKNLSGLKESEKEDLEKLKENLKSTAKSLENAKGQDARQIMSELEHRAREAEKLAERLGKDKDSWASDKLTQALRTHADTADLGDAVAARNANHAANAAESLANQLKSSKLPDSARQRLQETLNDIEKAAEKEDRQRTVGQHVLQSSDELKQGRQAEAGAEFNKLADKMRDQARREKSREELEKLAQQLRDAGSNIAGQNEAGGMQQMNAATGNNSQSQQGQTPQVSQTQSAQNQQGALQPPGLNQSNQNQSQQQGQNQGQQGQGQSQQMQLGQMGQAGQPGQKGQQQGNQGTPMLMAPVPGQKLGDKPPEMFVLDDSPGDTTDGGASITLSVPGGNQPGVGKAELKADATDKQDSSNSRVVNAQQNSEGQSSVRTVEGGVRQESATRTTTQTAVEFIQAEEEALDDAALPPSRRDQIRRYFNELRRRFEQQP